MALQQPPNAIITLRQQPVRATPGSGSDLKRTRDLDMDIHHRERKRTELYTITLGLTGKESFIALKLTACVFHGGKLQGKTEQGMCVSDKQQVDRVHKYQSISMENQLYITSFE